MPYNKYEDAQHIPSQSVTYPNYNWVTKGTDWNQRKTKDCNWKICDSSQGTRSTENRKQRTLGRDYLASVKHETNGALCIEHFTVVPHVQRAYDYGFGTIQVRLLRCFFRSSKPWVEYRRCGFFLPALVSSNRAGKPETLCASWTSDKDCIVCESLRQPGD